MRGPWRYDTRRYNANSCSAGYNCYRIVFQTKKKKSLVVEHRHSSAVQAQLAVLVLHVLTTFLNFPFRTLTTSSGSKCFESVISVCRSNRIQVPFWCKLQVFFVVPHDSARSCVYCYSIVHHGACAAVKGCCFSVSAQAPSGDMACLPYENSTVYI